MMEYLDIRTKDGERTGEKKARTLVHRDGDIHGTVHTWIIRRLGNGYELLLQKRSENKDAFPGCYDISSAGHLSAGQEYMEAALREMEEELGIRAIEEELQFLGIYEGYFEEEFHGKPFRNHEISHVYLYDGSKINIEQLRLQESEVESVRWMTLEECKRKIGEKDERYRCLIPEELAMIEKYMGLLYKKSVF